MTQHISLTWPVYKKIFKKLWRKAMTNWKYHTLSLFAIIYMGFVFYRMDAQVSIIVFAVASYSFLSYLLGPAMAPFAIFFIKNEKRDKFLRDLDIE